MAGPQQLGVLSIQQPLAGLALSCPRVARPTYLCPTCAQRPINLPTQSPRPPCRRLTRYQLHAGSRLAPPLGGPERMASYPALEPTDVEVAGDSWKTSSVDVAIAGAQSA